MTRILYTVEREFNVPVDRLFAAWAEADQLAAWYGPVGFSSPRDSVTMDPNLGGRWSATVVVPIDGSKHHFFGEILEITINEKMIYSMLYTNDDAEFALRDLSGPAHRVELFFEARGDKSWMSFTQIGDLPEGQDERAKEGMESYFDSLETFLAE
mgnify:CR=1 FL=1